jgi:hypothetical protein
MMTPFHTGVLALTGRMPRSATIVLTSGCHDGTFFSSQRHASIKFLGYQAHDRFLANRSRDEPRADDSPVAKGMAGPASSVTIALAQGDRGRCRRCPAALRVTAGHDKGRSVAFAPPCTWKR